ncbi:MAG: terminase gpA endonuclease subunit [Pseudomonadota bacterium]
MSFQALAQQGDLFPSVELTPGEIEAWRRKEPLTVSQWAERYRRVTDGPWQGEWRNERTPYLVEPMDTWGLPHLREEWVIGPLQGGKTTIAYNCWAYGQHYDQAWALFVMADEKSAHKVSKDRLQPLIKTSPALSQLLTGSPLDLGNNELRLQASVTYMAWPRSEASLASFPIPQVFLDEVDLWPQARKDTMEAVELARARTTVFPFTSKVLGVTTCTVEEALGWKHLCKCQEVRVYMARCPFCAELQIMRREQLRWDDSLTDDPDRVEAENLAWYECEHCQAGWTDLEKRRAVQAGCFQPHRWDSKAQWWDPAPPVSRAIKVGFHFSAFYSPFVSLGKIAAQAIKALSDPQAEVTLFNKMLALPYRSEQATRSEAVILALCDNRQPGLVPADAVALIAGVDVQRAGFYFTIRAWAPGPERESWLVRAGFVDSWAALEKALFQDQYLDPASQACVIAFGLVDSGDGEMTREVYDWCHVHPPFAPSKGYEGIKAQPYRQSKIDTHPGLLLFGVNTNYYKSDLLDGKLRISPGDGGAWHLHNNWPDGKPPKDEKAAGLLTDYARQLCSEERDERGLWQNPRRRANHYLDCEVLQLVCADYLGLRYMAPEPEPETDHEPENQPLTRSHSRW